MNTSGIIQAVARQKVQQQIMSSSVRPWTSSSSLVIYQGNYIRRSSSRSTNFEVFKAQIGKLLMKHIVLTLRATNIILLHRRPSIRIMSSSIRIMHIIHRMHTLAYICCKYLLFMIKVFEKNQDCINTLLLTSKISVSKVQENKSFMKSETRKLSCVKVHSTGVYTAGAR